MAREQLELEVFWRQHAFDEAEAGDDGAVDGGEVVGVGLDAGVGDLAEVVRGERVDEADFKAGLLQSALDGPVVLAGAFDGDDEIP